MNALISTITGYWQGRSDREQILLAAMGALVLVLVAQLLVVQPLMNFHARARTDYSAAMQLYRSIEADAATYRELSANAVQREANSAQSMRSIVGSLALTNNIAIARLIPGEDGTLTVNIERAETASVMRWLIELEESYGIQVMSSTLDRAGDQFVQANLVLRRTGGA